MACIPSALVQIDWGAIATTAGALVSAGVVWSAFRVQSRQWERESMRERIDRKDNALQAAEAAVSAITALLRVGPTLEEDPKKSSAIAAHQFVQMHYDIIEYYINNGVYRSDLLRILFQTRSEIVHCQSWLVRVENSPSLETILPGQAVILANHAKKDWLELRESAAQALRDEDLT